MMIKISDQEKAIDALSNDRKAEIALISAAACGMTTVELTALEFASENPPLQVTEKTIYNILNRLADSQNGFPPLFSVSKEFISGQQSGAKKVFRLTEFGRETIEAMYPDITIRFMEDPTNISLRHRFCQLEVYILARKNGWEAEIERVISYEDENTGESHNVRCDVVLYAPDGPIFVEIEQKIIEASETRIRQKFENWQRFVVAAGDVTQLLLFFNLDQKSRDKTMALWEKALWEIRQKQRLDYSISYLMMSNLRTRANLEEDIRQFATTLKPQAPVQKAKAMAAPEWTPPVSIESYTWAIDNELSAFGEIKTRLDNYFFHGYEYLNIKPLESMARLLRIAKIIHDVDTIPPVKDLYREFNIEVGLDKKTTLIPFRSLLLLRYFLTHEDCTELYWPIKEKINQMQTKGVTQARILMNEIIWEGVFRYFYIGHSEDFRVRTIVPDYGGAESHYEVKILNIPGPDKFHRDFGITDDHKIALEWMLEAIFMYPDILGLKGKSGGNKGLP
jgi:DNA-binding PadR family transcriptional regulator